MRTPQDTRFKLYLAGATSAYAMPPRRGMIIKNVAERYLEVALEGRTIEMQAEEEVMITADEVRDPVLRENLQLRTVAIVRPATIEESEALRDHLRATERGS